jgi:hypothetical protein
MWVRPALFGLVAFALAALAPMRGNAGCGCDHPPPIQGFVFPRFAWPERPVAVYAPGRDASAACLRVGNQLLTNSAPEAGLCANGVRPQMLTVRYTGRPCPAPGAAGGDAGVRCSDRAAALPPAAHIRVTEVTDASAVWFEGTVSIDGPFTIDAKRAGATRLTAARVTVRDGSGTIVQEIDFDASCKWPLALDQNIGALQLLDVAPEYETTADLSDDDQATARLVMDEPGPKAISVYSRPCEQVRGDTSPVATYPDSEFTMLAAPIPVVEREGTMRYGKVDAAVSTDGTLLVPFDLTNVVKPMQFFVVLRGLPLRFGVDDVVYYNRDQYNLKLFERVVNGPEDFQWGPYYGTTVTRNAKAERDSSVIGYWRHEFDSYRMAHLPNGTHAVGANGLHPDGTPHIDHNHVVLAINGQLVDPDKPDDRTAWRRLAPGRIALDVEVYQLASPAPVELTRLSADQQQLLNNQYAVYFDVRSGLLREVKRIGLPERTGYGIAAAR